MLFIDNLLGESVIRWLRMACVPSCYFSVTLTLKWQHCRVRGDDVSVVGPSTWRRPVGPRGAPAGQSLHARGTDSVVPLRCKRPVPAHCPRQLLCPWKPPPSLHYPACYRPTTRIHVSVVNVTPIITRVSAGPRARSAACDETATNVGRNTEIIASADSVGYGKYAWWRLRSCYIVLSVFILRRSLSIHLLFLLDASNRCSE